MQFMRKRTVREKLTSTFSTLFSHKIVLLLFVLMVIALALTLFLVQQQQTIKPGTTTNCNHTGVTKHADGTYTFAQLHLNEQGISVDTTGCEVYLLGCEGKGATVNRQYGGYGVDTTQGFSYILLYIQAVPQMNLLRPWFDADAWNDNTFVSAANMHYQEFLKTYIKAIEGYGLYVELNNYPARTTPQSTTQALAGIAAAFKNDPAVLFDVRNEGTMGYSSSLIAENNQFITAVRTNNPTALVSVFGAGINETVAGTIPVYTQGNVMFDFHLYSGYVGNNPETGWSCNEPNRDWQYQLSTVLPRWVSFLHSKGLGLIINEWGGCYDVPEYNTAMTNFVIQNHIVGLSYFDPHNWIYQGKPDGNAQRVSQAYTTVFGSPYPYAMATPTPNKYPNTYCAINLVSRSRVRTSLTGGWLNLSASHCNGPAHYLAREAS
jgi:hypothetical protein